LPALKGRFLLSINDHPIAREVFGRFHCRTVELTYTVTKRPRKCTELLFADYPISSLPSTLTSPVSVTGP
jgi:DNA adenine methylase